jgi:very-short-patch-repair endonuclease
VAIAARPPARAVQISPASSLSKFILDFVCFEKRLIVEIDGSQHADSDRDTAREAVLLAEGFRIARYWNNDVLQRHTSVLEDVLAKLSDSES